MKKYTQAECNELFIEELQYFLKKTKEIDKLTPYSEIEPKWWLAMSEIRRMCFAEIDRQSK